MPMTVPQRITLSKCHGEPSHDESHFSPSRPVHTILCKILGDCSPMCKNELLQGGVRRSHGIERTPSRDYFIRHSLRICR